jgi:hypothetical protein
MRNMHRTRSLYEYGMLPRIKFENPEGEATVLEGWHTDPCVTQNVKFFQTNQNDNFDQTCIRRERVYQTVSFIYSVQRESDSIYFAYDQPYTYSQDLRVFLDSIRFNRAYSPFLQVSHLCKSVGGADLKMLTITENALSSFTYFDLMTIFTKKELRDRFNIRQQVDRVSPTEARRMIADILGQRHAGGQQESRKVQLAGEQGAEDETVKKEVGIETKYRHHLLVHAHKKAMIITSRVHPGETQSSFALEGIVQFLLSDAIEARQLRQNYIFYVVPMLNPDGVIRGNQRTDLTGVDMNRRWIEPSPFLYPQIVAVRNLVQMI